jgi:hypothetical protein
MTGYIFLFTFTVFLLFYSFDGNYTVYYFTTETRRTRRKIHFQMPDFKWFLLRVLRVSVVQNSLSSYVQCMISHPLLLNPFFTTHGNVASKTRIKFPPRINRMSSSEYPRLIRPVVISDKLSCPCNTSYVSIDSPIVR